MEKNDNNKRSSLNNHSIDLEFNDFEFRDVKKIRTSINKDIEDLETMLSDPTADDYCSQVLQSGAVNLSPKSNKPQQSIQSPRKFFKTLKVNGSSVSSNNCKNKIQKPNQTNCHNSSIILNIPSNSNKNNKTISSTCKINGEYRAKIKNIKEKIEQCTKYNDEVMDVIENNKEDEEKLECKNLYLFHESLPLNGINEKSTSFLNFINERLQFLKRFNSI